jgi:hypothetical protein
MNNKRKKIKINCKKKIKNKKIFDAHVFSSVDVTSLTHLPPCFVVI